MFYIGFDSQSGTARFHTITGDRFGVARTWEMAYPFESRGHAESILTDPRIPSDARVMTRDEAIARMAQDD
jgi:hypothetical protein